MTTVLVIAVVCLVAVVLFGHDFGGKNAQAGISAWAEKNGYQVIDLKRRDVLRGPFLVRPNTQTVCRVSVKTGNEVITGWLLLSFLKQQVLEVVWDKSNEA